MQSEGSLATFQDLKKFIDDLGVPLDFKFHPVNPCGFRLKAKLAVRKQKGDVVIGLFKEGTHDVIDKEACMLHHPKINEGIILLKTLINALKIEPYDEKTHKGEIRYVQWLVNEKNQVQLVLVVTLLSEDVKQLAQTLFKKGYASSIWVNIQNQITNTIFSEHFEHVCGESLFFYELFGKKIYFHPGSFCQANLWEFSTILTEINARLDKKKKALDLYSGAGLFGLCLESHFDTILFAETNPFSKEAFDESVRHASFKKGQFLICDAKTLLKEHLEADVVFIDPPRKGLEKAIKPLLGELKKGAQVFYISCGAESLKRDLKELLLLGFTLKFIKSYQFFPGSKEIETLCLLEKAT
jgi:23S rRNA (uracil1939-C5)-methyltransferase